MLGHIGAILGASWGIFGNLERFWGFVGAFLGPSWPIWGSFGTLFGPTWGYLGLFEAILGHLGGILCLFLGQLVANLAETVFVYERSEGLAELLIII